MSRPVRLDAATVEWVTHYQTRVLQEVLSAATEAYWERRAAQFAAVGTPACDEIALACRRAATLAQWPDLGDGPL